MRVNLIKIIPIQVDPLVILKRAMKDVATEENGLTFEDYISENIYDLIETVYSIDVSDEDTELDDDDIDSLIDTINNVMEETK